MTKYQRIVKKYYKHKKKHQNKVINTKLKKTYFDSLYTRFFLSSLLLLLMVLLNTLFQINIKHLINSNYNFTKLGYNLLSTFIENKTDDLVSSIDLYDKHTFKNNLNIFESNSYNGVNCLKEGTIIKIEKNNSKYNITIQTVDDFLWTYYNLESIDCYLYQYISENDLIGSSSYDDNYQFMVSILKNEKFYSIKDI